MTVSIDELVSIAFTEDPARFKRQLDQLLTKGDPETQNMRTAYAFAKSDVFRTRFRSAIKAGEISADLRSGAFMLDVFVKAWNAGASVADPQSFLAIMTSFVSEFAPEVIAMHPFLSLEKREAVLVEIPSEKRIPILVEMARHYDEAIAALGVRGLASIGVHSDRVDVPTLFFEARARFRANPIIAEAAFTINPVKFARTVIANIQDDPTTAVAQLKLLGERRPFAVARLRGSGARFPDAAVTILSLGDHDDRSVRQAVGWLSRVLERDLATIPATSADGS
jgi:hypothetical protein